MEEDQQFCLRWNNHQSTLISVFDTLLENGTLVDCTLAAEGKFLKAHKVVLSACSPYFATLLSEQYDKHPIFILKDVKYQELRAMMDYMYRGEVNISQDQLAALLKAAESLQIKGLSDNRGGGAGAGSKAGEPQKHSTTGHHVPGKMTNIGHMGAGYTLEQAKRARIGPSSIDSQDIGGSREGSSSPTSRRRKKIRRRSVDNVMGDNHENSNSSQNMQINSSVTGPGAITTSIVPSGAVAQAASGNQIQTQTNKKTDNLSKLDQGVSVSTINPAASATATLSDEHDEDTSTNKKDHHLQQQQQLQSAAAALKKDHKDVVGGAGVGSGSATSSSDIVIEPKSEYDDGNEETVEDLTLDDEMALDELDQTAGPSHGGEGSSQGYAQWQVDRSHDESYMAQDVQQRDPQDYLHPIWQNDELFFAEFGEQESAAATADADVVNEPITDEEEESTSKNSSSQLNNEEKREKRASQFVCGECGKSYKHPGNLSRHIRLECDVPAKYKCLVCKRQFRQLSNMRRHVATLHRPNKKSKKEKQLN